ncbi:Ppx/GppA family phosphatase [Aurantiacibacter spongiae]|uniref:Ppx/GppA family phosphatase n=1 Tax=Aurantiacibacter spongiae TaxID=2488860 RepID=A0A3N5DHB3_9SPHN|nr:Ppx/GppA family phosphatase [Aurantiacibacter spongiae]RPF71052.1 Ppx/GppA family phosphatase [Aurantiacibacter spongiae]
MIASAKRDLRLKHDGPQRAVIDIGSNTVRLVVYSGPPRAPAVWLNEKVTARLGRDLATTGRIPEDARELALAGLARFALICRDIGVADVQTVATAATRDACNGPAFVESVEKLGLDVRVLTGEEEAEASAYGVIGGFPGARGVVADLGGGSLELVAIENGKTSHGVSLPLGTLRLPALRERGPTEFRKAVKKDLTRADWARHHDGPLYMVGGTWRALATFAMHKSAYPLTDPQAFTLRVDEAEKIARKLEKADPNKLEDIPGISSSRAAGLPDAAAMLRPLLKALRPDGLVFSSWGLREGLLYRSLDPLVAQRDPLLAAIAHFTEPRGASMSHATQIAAWTSEAARGGERTHEGEERLRLAAMMLAMAQMRLEPNMRLAHSFDWAMEKRWLGLSHRGRALIGAALRGACGNPEPTDALNLLASGKSLREAAGWGLAFRLCRRLGAGSRASLLTSRLNRSDDALTLWIEPERMELVSDIVKSELATLAEWLDLDWRIEEGVPAHGAEGQNP